MKLMIVCSESFYDKVEFVKDELIKRNIEIILPNGYNETLNYKSFEEMTQEEYSIFFKDMFQMSQNKIENSDGIIVLNYSKIKNGEVLENYIGPSTFLEMYTAFMNNKKIYMINDFPKSILLDELKAFNPIIINGDFEKVV